MTNHIVVSREKWLAARKALLVKEKKHTRERERLAQERRNLPWVKVEKDYTFDGPSGRESLAQLFGKKSQLVVYHFMFGQGWKDGCPHCSFWSDHYDAMRPHLGARDVNFVVVSHAPLAEIKPFQKRMGWNFHWVSSNRNDFNYDYRVSFTPQELKNGTAVYNYAKLDMDISDREGISVFYKDKRGQIFHTYSAFARGIDAVNTTYQFLDLVPKGRDERGRGQFWVRYHDRYKS
jgi:predicted dithiol-disulfide oxidoreductase (DUF899 family)